MLMPQSWRDVEPFACQTLIKVATLVVPNVMRNFQIDLNICFVVLGSIRAIEVQSVLLIPAKIMCLSGFTEDAAFNPDGGENGEFFWHVICRRSKFRRDSLYPDLNDPTAPCHNCSHCDLNVSPSDNSKKPKESYAPWFLALHAIHSLLRPSYSMASHVDIIIRWVR